MVEENKKPASLKDTQDRRASFNRAVREANLVTILLTELSYKVNRKIKRDESHNQKLIYGGNVSEFSCKPDRTAIFAGITWKVEIKRGNKLYAKCVARYDVIYNGFTAIDDEIALLFAENTAQPATYAYFRALFASLDWSAELGTPPLPVIKFFPKI